jgi:hypothetical protein
VKQLSAAMRDLLTRSSPLDDAEQAGLGKLAALQGVRRFPSRIKCAMLGWCALDECLNGAFDPSLPKLFAYPNGNFSTVVDAELQALGYEIALLFDHRRAWRDTPRRMSRLRIDSAAPPPRFRAIVSGVHGALFHVTHGSA